MVITVNFLDAGLRAPEAGCAPGQGRRSFILSAGESKAATGRSQLTEWPMLLDVWGSGTWVALLLVLNLPLLVHSLSRSLSKISLF